MSNLASTMEGEGEFEFREEELVDFEGSDYSIGFDNEFGDEEVGGPLTSIKVDDILLEQNEHAERAERKITYSPNGDHINTAGGYTIERPEVEDGEAAPKLSGTRHSSYQDGSESGEIENEKDEIEDVAVSQSAFSIDNKDLEDKGWQGRERKHLRADLEDGELEDAAMLESFNYEGEGNIEACGISDECVGQERKRRSFEYLAEWQTDIKGRDSMEAQSTATGMVQNHLRGRRSDHSGNFPKCKPGARGSNMHMFGRPHTNLAPGIMGSTRPMMPRGLGGPVNHFGVPLGMPTPIQFQEAMLQEQIMMSNHALHLGVTGPGHPLFNMDVPPHPFVGMDYFGARPRGMMPIHPHGPGMVPQINCFGAFGNTSRGQRPMFGVSRGLGRGSCANFGGRGGSFSRNGFGRPAAWPSSPFDMPAASRGRGRGHPVPLSLRHDQSKKTVRSHFRAQQMVVFGHEVIIDVNNSDKINQEGRKKWNPVERENIASSKNINDAHQQSNNEKIENNVPFSASNSSVTYHSVSNMTKTHIEDKGKTAVSSMLETSTSNSRELGSSAPSMIKLGVPVQRSRVLSVGGLPEGTPVSVITEAFEKQGKIMDVKKEERGDVFTITFSTLLEAVSAKRLLHRSILGGKQITVDYSV